MIHQVKTQLQHSTVLPQQIQLLKLFHLTSTELQQRISEEIDENPLLEENLISDNDEVALKETVQDYQDEEEYQYDDIPDYKTEHNNYLSDSNLPQLPISEPYNFRKDLKEQVRFTFEKRQQIEIADYLIDSLNESGMLDQSLEEITDDYSFRRLKAIDASEVARVRNMLKELAPGGVGCFTIREYLLFQLNKLAAKSPVVKKAILLLEKFPVDFNFRDTEKLTRVLNIDNHELNIVLQIIRNCKLKPITEIDSFGVNGTIIPDFIIRRNEDGFEISLYHQRSATLFINNAMANSINKQNTLDKRALQYLKGKLSSAQWFVDAIRQREITMQKVMRVIIELQFEYFKNGEISALKPMILKNITDHSGVDISTVSRITCNKYADTHFGIVCLKDLFSEGIENAEGKSVSNRVIQSAIAELVKNEDKKKQFTDRQLVTLLSAKGYSIARRTVAKYREQLRIPAAQYRQH
ncbi:MAG TPA: RNA polymerase factor sigma-54 [Cyclobacteriaceae bacterium]|jgi:RNA polymerase sigma-54 factor|nr:RNA polymerase factor sigma-54 [Cyclobacteriaceae bacterium]